MYVWYIKILQQLCLVFGAFAVSFGLDQICSASFCNCISILNLFKLSVDFFPLCHLWKEEGGGEGPRKPRSFYIGLLIILLLWWWGFIIVIIRIFKFFPAARSFLHLSCRAFVQFVCGHPDPFTRGQKKTQEKEFGKGLRCSRGHSLPGSHPHPRQPRSGAGRDRCKLRRWAQKTESQPSLASVAGVKWCFTLYPRGEKAPPVNN